MNALNKPGFLQNNKTFQTIYGRNLLHELNIIIPEETLIVTMEDLWGNFSNFFTKDPSEDIQFVSRQSFTLILSCLKILGTFTGINLTFFVRRTFIYFLIRIYLTILSIGLKSINQFIFAQV